MGKIGKESLKRRLEAIEKMLEVNIIRVHYSDEKIAVGPDTKIIRLRWLDDDLSKTYQEEETGG